jgi:hypothetical protein
MPLILGRASADGTIIIAASVAPASLTKLIEFVAQVR